MPDKPTVILAIEPEAPVILSDPMYATLAGVLQAAHDHAARGKGHDRHGDDDTPFLEQPTMQIARMVGAGYPIGQIMKKSDEAKGMIDRGQYDAAIFELLGIINYAAAAILLIRETAPTSDDFVGF
ncbi:hypothetical protein [Bradyrhizobium cenepequi]